jgi:hypothetical protein
MASIEYGSYIVARCGYIAPGEIAAFDSCPSADTRKMHKNFVPLLGAAMPALPH